MNITTQIVLEDNLYMAFEINNGKLCFELDEPADKDLTFTLRKICPGKQDIENNFNQDEDVEPLDVGIYVLTFNTKKKTSLCIEFKDNKLSFEIL